MKWVYRVKVISSGEAANCKAKLIAKGFLQNVGSDNSEVIAPVARIETIKLEVATALFRGWS